MTSNNPVCWFEIYVDDMPRAKAFYEAVLGVKLEFLPNPDDGGDFPKPEMWTFPMQERPGAGGAICKMDGVSAGGNSTMVYFDSDDCSVEASRIEAAGGKLIMPKTAIGKHGFIAIAQDTEGNTIGLYSSQ